MDTSLPVVLSASSVTTFLRCGQQWYFAYVEGIKSPPTLKQARGIAVHKAVEHNMVQKLVTHTDVPLADMMDAYGTSFDAQGGDGFVAEDEASIGDIKDDGYKLVSLHHAKVSPTIQPVFVERPVQFNINGVTFSGQIDLQDDAGRIRDTKTTARKPSGDSYLLNMTGYALAKRHLDGDIESDIVLDYLVATKTPYYHPIVAGGPVSDDQIVRFANIVDTVAKSINAGAFTPSGIVSGACNWCGYKDICPSYDSKRPSKEPTFL